jgi:hypothetical protein
MRCWWEVQCCSAALISGYHVWLLHTRKITLWILWNTDRTTLTPLVDQLFILCYAWIFGVPLHKVVPIYTTLNSKGGFIRANKSGKIIYYHECAKTTHKI